MALTSAFVADFCSTASAESKNPALPRVEKVKEADGSTWEVLIVPRFPAARPSRTNLAAAPPMPSQNDAAAEKEAPAKENPPETKPAETPQAPANEFGVEIVPRFARPAHEAPAECCPPAESRPHVNPHDYVKVYNSIPFRRSEYIANPSYRHDATMELLTGNPHPKVAAAPQPRPHHTLFPYENSRLSPNSYYSYYLNSTAPGWGYGFGSSLLPYAPPNDYGLNYHLLYRRSTMYYPPF